MSIASEITRIKGAKTSLKTSIEAKGVSVPSTTKIDGYGALVDQISTGITPSGTTNITENGIYDVTNFASANVNVSGEDIDEYFETEPTSITTTTCKQWVVNNFLKKAPDIYIPDTATSLESFFDRYYFGITPKIHFNNNITSLRMLIGQNTTINSIDTTYWDTSNVTDMWYAFSSYNGEYLDVSNLDTSNVTDMSYMFNACKKISSLNLSNFNTSNVTTMTFMFCNSSKLTELNLSSFNTSNVTNMDYMFSTTTALINLNISSFDMGNVINCNNMLGSVSGTPKLANLKFGYDLGKAYLTTQSANYSNYTLDVSSRKSLTEESLISILNGLYDIATKGCNPQKCVLGSTNLAKLTSAEGQAALAQATNYGWTVS